MLDPNRKGFTDGTHRVRPPEETLEWLQPKLYHMGITRLADVTGLDDIGIPVYQAVRPGGAAMAVSQGKGISPALAKASALMEAAELWHAENVTVECVRAAVSDLQPALGYDVEELSPLEPSCLLGAAELDWLPARQLDSGEPSYVPFSLVDLDFEVFPDWAPPFFEASSNGLASGNTLLEATVHGLCEVIERDCLSRLDSGAPPGTLRAVDTETVASGHAVALLERYREAEVEVRVVDATGPVGLPVYKVSIWSPTIPIHFMGAGCHLDRDVALCRALTEAAQSRLTYVSGARDDIEASFYDGFREALTPPSWVTEERKAYEESPSVSTPDLADDLDGIVERVRGVTGRTPLVVDLTRDEIGIPVVRVVAPGLTPYAH